MLRPFIAFLLFVSTSASAATWYEHYENGVRAIEQGRAEAAKESLAAAVAARAEEGVQLPTRPQQYIDYLPHLYLAIAHQMTGDVEPARKELALAETSGMAAKSEVGRPLLVAYQLLLRGDAAGTRPRYAVFEKKAPVLSEEEFHLLRNDVLSKCDLPLDTKLSTAPWYANYELGLALERKGDYPRALTHFIDAVAERPNPQKQARMYGMWMIDYYPYFHIARSHVRLENWQCAKNALEISQRLGEIPGDAPELSELLSLQRRTEQRLK
ncbi:MAG: tetratricopeptide repeat protein, partial [Thermoanaerobaculia bacterium]